MDSIEAIFMAVGTSPTVLALADQLTGDLQQRRAIGDEPATANNPVEHNSIIVKLPLSNEDDASAFAETEAWLEQHASILKSTDARKIIEFQTFLDSNTGSRILTVPNSIVRICGDLGLDLANQAIRVLTKSEYDTVRSGEN